MLVELTVKHLAIIDDLTLRLGPGLNVLTGETGAGKSILVGAVQLALGSRASAETIRHGEDQAEVEAVFDLADLGELTAQLASEDLLDDGMLIVRRVVSSSGKNRVYIGGRAMPLARLVEIGQSIITIYGQHESRDLLEPENHLRILDEAGGLMDPVADFRARYEGVIALRRELSEMTRREAESAARTEYLRFVIRDIEGAKFETGEDEALAERRRILASAEKLAAVAREVLAVSYESEGSISERCGLLARRAGDAAHIDRAFEPIAAALESIAIAAQEAGRTTREYLETLTLDPGELEHIENRLETIRVFSKKYGGSLEAALWTLEDAKKEIGGFSSLGKEIAGLTRRAADADTDLAARARALSGERKKAAGDLARRVRAELSDLGMKGAAFSAFFSSVPEGVGIEAGGLRMEPGGAERCEFLFSANVGEAERPLARIASGGELSRIMLAIRNSMARAFFVPSLVFDEVDSGIGGAQAEIVGRKLAAAAKRHQVLCITHLPQIAGLADRHLVVEKKVAKGRTATAVREVSGEEREKELARMVGGMKITDATRATAREMMKR